MNREAGRSIGALSGLAIGVLVMWTLGYSGIIPLFLFGAGGTVAGGITGERIIDQRRGRGPITRRQDE
jgi:outer membrane lipoprotein SlyB